MKKLQRALNQELKKFPKLLLKKIVEGKLAEQKIVIPPVAVDALIDHMYSGKTESFKWSDGVNDDEDQKFSLSFGQEDLAEIDKAQKNLEKNIHSLIEQITETSADDLFETLKNNWTIEGAVQRSEIDQFRERLEERWSEGFELLRMLLTIARELGNETLKRHRRSKSTKHMHRRFVLMRLHARGCQIADEITTLMSNGFADGAMARWRTLHELAVVATLIEDGDEDLARRYIDHDAVDTKRQADDHDKSQKILGNSPIGKRQRQSIEKTYNDYIKKYGKSFGGLYGWAAKRLNLERPTFKDIQEAAGRAGMDIYYKLASVNIHAGSRAMFFRLTNMGTPEVLLAGRSNAGFVDPGKNMAFTLVQLTATLVGHVRDIDDMIELKTIITIRDAVPDALERADRKLRQDEAALRKKRSRRCATTLVEKEI